jgi:hypothetical protein
MQLDKFEIISMVGGYWKLAASIVHSILKFVISNLKNTFIFESRNERKIIHKTFDINQNCEKIVKLNFKMNF